MERTEEAGSLAGIFHTESLSHFGLRADGFVNHYGGDGSTRIAMESAALLMLTVAGVYVLALFYARHLT